MDQFDQLWGTDAMAALLVPSRAGDGRFLRWFAKGSAPAPASRSPRCSCARWPSPTYGRCCRWCSTDAHPAPEGVRAGAHLAWYRYLADHLAGATLVELPGSDVDLIWETRTWPLTPSRSSSSGSGAPPSPAGCWRPCCSPTSSPPPRAARVGDRRWRELLEVHDELAGRLVEQFHGQLVKTTGDGILATFDGPGQAIRCAAAFRDELAGIGVQIRPGCTPARSSCATATSVASRSTSRPGSWPRPNPADRHLQDGPGSGRRPRHRHGRPWDAPARAGSTAAGGCSRPGRDGDRVARG